jgi:hypothetical protein
VDRLRRHLRTLLIFFKPLNDSILARLLHFIHRCLRSTHIWQIL